MRLRSKTIVLALSLFGLGLQARGQEVDAPVAAPVAAQAAPPPVAAPATASQGPAPAKGASVGTKTVDKQKQGAGAKGSQGPKSKAVQQPMGGPPGGMPKPPKPPWTEFPLPKKKLFLDFTEASPDMIISLFARTSGITIIKEPGFKTPLTISSARAMNLPDAFELMNTVLEMQGYEFQKRGKFLVVGKKQPPPQPPMMAPPPPPKPVTKVYPIKYANAKEVARVVGEIFGAGADQNTQNQNQGRFGGFNPGMPQMMMGMPNMGGAPPKNLKVSAEEYSNSVIVTGLEADQAEVKGLIDQLDKASDSPLESEIFKLKSVPSDQAVDAVQEVLTANAPLGRGAGKQNQNQNQDYYFYRFGQQNNKTNSQTVIAIKQTNSILVVASKENMELVRNLIKNLDVPSDYTGTTFFIHLENAKASDVADLLNKAFTKQNNNNNNDNPFFFFFDGPAPKKSADVPTDIDESGKLVNIRDLTGKVTVIPDPNTNSLIVVTMPSNMKMIRGLVDKIDKIADQVMIETVIVEANLDKTTKLGIEWNFQQRQILNSAGTSGSGSTDFGLQSSATPLQGFKYTIGGTLYKAFLNTLETDTRFKVLSTPRIFTSNNVKATINVSQKVPYIKNQEANAVGNLISNYDFLDVGVVLDVTPRITSSGEVAMDVNQKADDLQSFTSYGAPIVNQRVATTTVSVKDGETIVLGGIIRSTYNNTENKIPFLGDLPLIGNLFKSSSKDIGKTELVVLMTPHIVRSASEAQRLRTEEESRLSGATRKAIQDQVGKPTP